MKYWQRRIFFPKWGDRFLTLCASLLLIAATFPRVFAQEIPVESGLGTVLGTPANVGLEKGGKGETGHPSLTATY